MALTAAEKQRRYRQRWKERDLEGFRLYTREAARLWRKRHPEAAKNRDLRRYGLSLQEYEELLARQGGVCAVCGSGPTRRKLAVDHDHASGRVRGLLCDRCNLAIGHAREHTGILQQMAAYLSKEEGNPNGSVLGGREHGN